MNRYLLLILFAAVFQCMAKLDMHLGWVGTHRTMVREMARTNPEGFKQLVGEIDRTRTRLF